MPDFHSYYKNVNSKILRTADIKSLLKYKHKN